MIYRKATILNSNGIHVRPSKVIAESVADYPGKIFVTKDDYTVDSINTMNLLTLGLLENDQVTIAVDGKDEALMAEKLVDLFEYHFDFPPIE